MSPCGTVPMPRPPHHDACASVETPIAPGDVRRVAVAGLHAVVVVARGEVEDLLPVRRLDHPPDVRRDERAPCEHAEVDRLEVANSV